MKKSELKQVIQEEIANIIKEDPRFDINVDKVCNFIEKNFKSKAIKFTNRGKSSCYANVYDSKTNKFVQLRVSDHLRNPNRSSAVDMYIDINSMEDAKLVVDAIEEKTYKNGMHDLFIDLNKLKKLSYF